MENMLLLAKFWGILMVAVSGTLLLRPSALREMLALAADEKMSSAFGLIALIVGAASVAIQNSWAADWSLSLTLISWSAVLKGVMRLGFSQGLVRMTQNFSPAVLRLWLLPILFFGLWLLRIAF